MVNKMMTLSIITLRIETPGMMALSMMTFSIRTHSLKKLTALRIAVISIIGMIHNAYYT